MTLAQVYWLITLPKIGEVLGFGLIVTGLILAFGCPLVWVICQSDYSSVKWKVFKKPFWIGVLSLVIGALLSAFIPSHKEIIAIYGISYLTQNKDLQEIPPKLFELANIKLDEIVDEVKK